MGIDSGVRYRRRRATCLPRTISALMAGILCLTAACTVTAQISADRGHQDRILREEERRLRQRYSGDARRSAQPPVSVREQIDYQRRLREADSLAERSMIRQQYQHMLRQRQRERLSEPLYRPRYDLPPSHDYGPLRRQR